MSLTELVARSYDYAEAHAALLVAVSVGMLISTFVVFPLVIVRLPAQYFVDRSRPAPLSRHRSVHLTLMALKNLLGVAIVLTGFLLFILPGQGLLTLLVGLTIMNYPGKFIIERWLVRLPHVLPALNWLRSRFGSPPFEDP